MPQLVKGGKHAYGWSEVAPDGAIALAPEALGEYALPVPGWVVLMSGSRTSGGIAVTTAARLAGSPLAPWALARGCREVDHAAQWERRGRLFCSVELRADGTLAPSVALLARYGVAPGDRLLGVRGSHLALALVARGPIVAEARRHPELNVLGTAPICALEVGGAVKCSGQDNSGQLGGGVCRGGATPTPLEVVPP